MPKKVDLTQGNIGFQLIKLAVPIMLTSFVQMAYNLTDMFWIGRLGTGAAAAVGTVGFFGWLGISVAMCAKIGLEVNVAQAAGRGDNESLKLFIRNGLSMTILLSIGYSIIIFILAPKLIDFFRMGNDVFGYDPTANAIVFLRILSLGMVFAYLNPSCSGIYNGLGRSKLPFMLNSVGLVLNIVLDPLLIYGVWIFPQLGIKGAAIATIISQFVVTMLFFIWFCRDFDFIRTLPSSSLKGKLQLKGFFQISREHYYKIVKIGLPPAIQSMLFAIIAIFTARIISQYGAIPIAVNRIGSQIESISWLTAGGFSVAVCAFVGQNFGAKKFDRVWKGFTTATAIMCALGVINTVLLLLFPEFLFKIFVSETETIRQGVIYLLIFAYSQLFMCIESSTAGAFNGLGKSMPPSIIGVTFNTLRIPVAIYLSSIYGLSGIWWCLSGSSILKGTILTVWFLLMYKKKTTK